MTTYGKYFLGNIFPSNMYSFYMNLGLKPGKNKCYVFPRASYGPVVSTDSKLALENHMF